MALPPFHGFGIFFELYAPIAYLVTAVVYAPRTENDPLAQPVIPTSDNMIDCLRKVPCNDLMTVPSLLEQIATSEEAIETLKKLDSVVRAISSNLPSPLAHCLQCFSGGPLPVKVGEKLWAAGVQLVSCYGGTEFGILAVAPHKQDVADGSNWMWMHFEDEPKIRWAPQEDETYELQVLVRVF